MAIKNYVSNVSINVFDCRLPGVIRYSVCAYRSKHVHLLDQLRYLHFFVLEKASYLWLRLLYNDSAQLLILSGTSDFRSNQYIGVARLEIVLVAAGKP